MFEALKRWITRGAGPAGWPAVSDWAREAGYTFKRTRDGTGFVIDNDAPGDAWRIEWGPSQRPYLPGHELRLRGDLRAGAHLNLLVITRPLMEQLERQVYEQTTEGNQTRMDDALPEEMRWLVLYGKLPSAEMKGLRDGFAAVGNVLPALSGLIDGPFGRALADARGQWLSAAEPMVLMVHRSRLTLRTGMPGVDVARLQQWLALFRPALQVARRHAEHWSQAALSPSTQPSLWNAVPDTDDTPPRQ